MYVYLMPSLTGQSSTVLAYEVWGDTDVWKDGSHPHGES